MYKILDTGMILHIPTNKVIPNDPFNTDYINYQEWLKQGNKPIPHYVPLSCINLSDYSINWSCVINSLKENFLKTLQDSTKHYIESKYPDVKQRSDLADKEYFENYLKLKGIDENTFRKDITELVIQIYDEDLSLEDAIEKVFKLYPVPANTNINLWNRALVQLLKVAIRTEFIQRVKQEYWNKVSEIEQLNDVDRILNYRIEFSTKLPI